MGARRRGRLAGRVAVVTGATGGIGRAVAAALEREGAEVVRVSRRARFHADVTSSTDVARLFARVRKRFGRLDLLVNCAGVAEMAPAVSTSDELWARALATNLTGTFLCCRAALKLMLPRRRGHIVNILSIAAVEVFPDNAAYCASKFGALGLTRVLREELRSRGIRVTAVLPGAVNTPLWDNYWPEAPRKKMLKPEDVAEAVVGAVTSREQVLVEEIVLRPIAGRL